MHFGIIINISIAAGSSGYALVIYKLYLFIIFILYINKYIEIILYNFMYFLNNLNNNYIKWFYDKN